jgi:hypothetical protein
MSIPLALIIAGIFLVLGFVIGNVVSLLAEDKNEPKEVTVVLPEGKEADTKYEGLMDVIHLWRDSKTKRLVAEIDGELYKRGTFLNQEQFTRLSLASVEMQDWVGIEGRVDPPDAADLVAHRMAVMPEEIEEEEDTLEFLPVELIKKGMAADVYIPEDSTSISGQINTILQTLLADSPLAHRAVRLMDIEGRGMVVLVGLDMYDGVEDVPDDNIRIIIRQAVAEWEQKKDEDANGGE